MPQAALVPELLCNDIAVSRAFYVDILGFTIQYERPEDRFLYLALGAAELMLEEAPLDFDNKEFWWTAPPVRPLGRGVNFEINAPNVDAIHERVVAIGTVLFRPMEESWYRSGRKELGCRQFLVQDPDGYLLRFSQDIGTRPVNHKD